MFLPPTMLFPGAIVLPVRVRQGAAAGFGLAGGGRTSDDRQLCGRPAAAESGE